MHSLAVLVLLAPLAATAGAPPGPPIRIAVEAEFGHATSTSAEAIRRGAEVAVDELNARGGVLGGRRLELVTRDDRSVPARGVDNVRELAADPQVVAVLTGKYSPVVEDLVPVVQELGLPLVACWSAADAIVDEGRRPSYVFRVSLKDAWALGALVRGARTQGLHRLGLVVPNTGWGRSSVAAAQQAVARSPGQSVVATAWYNFGDQTLLPQYRTLLDAGADAVLLVANEGEGAILLRELAALPARERRPILSHWGVTGGRFPALAGDALREVPLLVVQTYSFVGDGRPIARRVVAALQARYGVAGAREIASPVGVAHAYDAVHLLALAIERAGSADRAKVRDALERLPPYRGLVRTYAPAFTPGRHEALAPEVLFLSRYAPDGVLVRAGP